MDEGFWGKEEREDLKRQISTIGAEAVVYYVDTPIEEIRERVTKRNGNLTKESFEISQEMLQGYLALWRPPGGDEDYLLARELK